VHDPNFGFVGAAEIFNARNKEFFGKHSSSSLQTLWVALAKNEHILACNA
jgi:hypothetical protein